MQEILNNLKDRKNLKNFLLLHTRLASVVTFIYPTNKKSVWLKVKGYTKKEFELWKEGAIEFHRSFSDNKPSVFETSIKEDTIRKSKNLLKYIDNVFFVSPYFSLPEHKVLFGVGRLRPQQFSDIFLEVPGEFILHISTSEPSLG